MATATLERPAPPREISRPSGGREVRRDSPIPGEITPEELLAWPDSEHVELVNGRPVERELGFCTSLVVSALSAELDRFVRANKLGWTPASECGYQCFEPDQSRVRKPDASFISRARMPGTALHEGYVRFPPDLAVEVVSSNDLANGIQEKVEDYLGAGVRLVWVIYPETGVAQVLRADGTTARLTRDDSLDGEDVLPGFRCRLGDLFPPPPPREAGSDEAD